MNIQLSQCNGWAISWNDRGSTPQRDLYLPCVHTTPGSHPVSYPVSNGHGDDQLSPPSTEVTNPPDFTSSPHTLQFETPALCY
jgi:hypothetical protein